MQTLPPVRSGSSSDSTSQKQKKRKKQATRSTTATSGKCTKSTRIRSYDYKSWDQFDVVSSISTLYPSLQSCFRKCIRNVVVSLGYGM